MSERAPPTAVVAWLKPFAALFTLYLYVSWRYDARPLLQQSGPLSSLGAIGDLLPFLMAAITAMLLLAWTEVTDRVKPVHERFPPPRGARPLLLHAVTIPPFLWATHLVFSGGALSGLEVAAWIASTLAVALTGLNLAIPFRGQPALLRALSMPLLLGATLGGLAWLSGQLSGQLWTPMAEVTLYCVKALLSFAGQPVHVVEGTRVIGLTHFEVDIAPECSGYEGVGLIALFLSAYLYKFRKELRFPAALWLPVIGVIAIWLLNNLRIAALLLVGEYISVPVAVGGFHSKAGWFVFCGITIGMVALANRSQWLHARPLPRSGARDRPAGPYLLPLIVLLAVSLMTGLLTPGFDYFYPLRVLAAGAAAAYSLHKFRPDSWLPRAEGWLGGLAVLGAWLALVPADPATDQRFQTALDGMPFSAQVSWIIFRVVGASIVVPVVEELAFRGFLLRRFVREQFEEVGYRDCPWWALLLSSVAFGLLHSAWISGTLAGVCYGLVLMRTRRLYDAIFAHGLTNGLLAAYVLWSHHWSLW